MGVVRLQRQDIQNLTELATHSALSEDESGRLSLIAVKAGDSGHQFYQQVCDRNADLDPAIQPAYMPAGGVIPPIATWPAVMMEVWSIIMAYQPLLPPAFAFGAVPIVPALAVVPRLAPVFLSSQIAARSLVERIQNPGVGFPAINGLGAGTYVCTIQYMHANCIINVQVDKN